MTIEVTGGRPTHYGPRESNGKFGGKSAKLGSIVEIHYDFSYDDLPTDDSGNEMVLALPAGARLVDSVFKVGTAWAGGTSLTVGLAQKDGTVIDADGLHTAAQLVTASMTAGAVLVGGGALIDASIGSDAGVVEVAATGTYTAGTAQLIVRYQPLGADNA